ncbi:twin-arginine translocase subunit TatC [Pelotomaculum terephthalicicum JT]|uniref:twin-arginine translocase subunit TatC n=1 Tax=Pelotomaculum TaxID=191373 RepID=UPI0009D5AEEE|nr:MULTISPECIES: twin-arginine translocase subunit TatC [Pelotomaculum]MCG9969338.1 twin-arginine translocase subunit TatC [Pelotomaculum terephthalicicum JT]OPX86404.1 MAG: Sec-independent protein translocase protein TatC [Pelotomaculum sp. PtaB.Bin117]OPY62135.1 MAG: Sec-independent protein translocase protein TatC [Pelotomaculum sp. PtaU1.Bin065]
MAKNTDEMPMLEHLEELRRVLIISIVSTTILAVVAYFFCDRILAILLEPLTNVGQRANFTGVTEPIFVKIKLSFFVGFLTSLPIILWQVWSFIVPALKKNERVYFTLFVLISFISFIGGVAFGFWGVYRLGITFLLQFAGPELAPMLTIDKYISFTIGFLLPFGVVFEFPLITYFLAKLELITYSFLAKNRRYAILAIVVLAAVITPTPDIITCSIVTGPMYLLYELSAIIVRFVERGIARKKQRQQLAEIT